MNIKHPLFTLATLPFALSAAFAQTQQTQPDSQVELGTVYVTAERQLQQQLGVSKIPSSEIEKRPTADISEFVRTMPGVNLTGNSATGQRGNKRQIDLRGMGPENTLILIDGKPVHSRQSERMSMRGERNTRGDSGWVPPEAIESISVLRGPAAARYGSGAMGGVVNITTKRISNDFKGSIHYYTNQPQDSREGATNRAGFYVSGPVVKDKLSFRIYGSAAKTQPDAADINNAASGSDTVAGVEGVRNRDIAGRLHWKINDGHSLTLDSAYSRQGNIYNGDTQNSNGGGRPNADLISELAASKAETARLYRRTVSLTHNGVWDWGDIKTTLSSERTTNRRLPEFLSGGPEGSYSSREFTDSRLRNLRFASEANLPFEWGVPHVVTIGTELTDSRLNDAASNSQGFTDRALNNGQANNFPGVSAQRPATTSQQNWAIFAEDNISLTDKTKLIPALRFDHNSKSGGNWSPALNFAHQFGNYWTVKGGIARAYKAPNLYQSNADYITYTRGNGCPIGTADSISCYYMGNSNLKPETSINKEIGFEFAKDRWQASLAYFHNAYRNKIEIGDKVIATSNLGNYLLQWENARRAVVEGFEGNISVPLAGEKLKWHNNFTYMRRSVNKDTGNPLSLTPKHTINSTLAWTPSEKWDANLTFTHYGRIKPRSNAENRVEAGQGGGQPLSASQNAVGSYGIWGMNAGYRFTKASNIRLGVNNIFNKKIYRTGNGAQTFNEHGRAFYGSLKVQF